jgi:hypothetical protein
MAALMAGSLPLQAGFVKKPLELLVAPDGFEPPTMGL